MSSAHANLEWSFAKMDIGVPLHRKCSCGGGSHSGGDCEACKEKKELQRKSTHAGAMPTVPSVVQEVLSSPGQPLDAGARSVMEAGFGANLRGIHANPASMRASGISQPSDPSEIEADHMASRVLNSASAPRGPKSTGLFDSIQIHTDPKAARSAQAVNAHAYTVGNHIVFAPGMYTPHSPSGQRLLAHELTHVVQQQGRCSNTISRFKVTDCDPKKNPDETPASVTDAHKLAFKMLQAANAAVNSAPSPAVIKAAAEHFKIMVPPTASSDKKNWGRARMALSTMLQADSHATYECEPKQSWWNGGCVSGVEAISLFNIHLCPLWWKDHPTTLERAAILVHEWGHKWGKGVNRVFESYRFDKKYKGLSAEKRLGLPDAYMAFVFELFTGSPPPF
ncbi:MAG: eCIS core domain-containing protein [Acidobacteriaceae bacterium]